MKLTEKIDSFMKANNISNLGEFAKNADIPYTTLRGLYEKGYEKAKRNTLIKLKDYMHITLDELADDNIDIDFFTVKKSDINYDFLVAFSEIGDYQDLDEQQKEMVRTMIKTFKNQNSKK